MLDLHMMTITGGRARSLAEFTALLPEVGLEADKGDADKLRPRHYRSRAGLNSTYFPGPELWG